MSPLRRPAPFYGQGRPRQNSSPRCRIWWDADVLAYRIQTPFNEQFIEAIKKLIPGGDRSYDPDTKIWLFTERYFEPVKTLAQAVWPTAGEVVITTKDQTQKASVPPATAKQPLNDSCEKFMRVMPYEAALAAYRKAATILHPDKGGDMEKMAQLNVLWNKISKEIYNQ